MFQRYGQWIWPTQDFYIQDHFTLMYVSKTWPMDMTHTRFLHSRSFYIQVHRFKDRNYHPGKNISNSGVKNNSQMNTFIYNNIQVHKYDACKEIITDPFQSLE